MSQRDPGRTDHGSDSGRDVQKTQTERWAIFIDKLQTHGKEFTIFERRPSARKAEIFGIKVTSKNRSHRMRHDIALVTHLESCPVYLVILHICCLYMYQYVVAIIETCI